MQRRRGAVLPASLAIFSALALAAAYDAVGQNRPLRQHPITQSDGNLDLEPATQQPPEQSRVSITVQGDNRVIEANGLPNHLVGEFPNAHDPNAIMAQRYLFDFAAMPQAAASATPLGLFNFGLAVNGVAFDPGAAEWYQGNRNGGWRYEALSGAIPLGLDQNYAHAQRNGAYHYHGLPTLLLEELGVQAGAHSPLVGWAADGFPIYALYGYADPHDAASGIKKLTSSYRVKSGARPSGGDNPGGTYDGTFIADYEYVAGAGDLDECNGRETVTPDYPKGTYAYFLTEDWPVIPRCFTGTPSKAFTEQRQPR